MSAFDLGTYTRPVTTGSAEAQAAFDRGLLWVYGYNHEEAAEAFEEAIDADPGCGAAMWGLAYAVGPNYNKPWEFFTPEERAETLTRAHAVLDKAKALRDQLSQVENDLIDALAGRYPTDPAIEDFAPWNDAFSDAMRDVYGRHGTDLDVITIFAEALMNRTPWLLWDLPTGLPAEGASTKEAQAVLETAFDTVPGAWDHPGLLHMYIHLMEMSPTPEAALKHGDRLTDLVPDSGHLIHMASHIDVLCGDYLNVVARNRKAARIDRKYEDLKGAKNFYTVYRIHNVHFEAYGAMFLGQPDVALAASDRLMEMLPVDVVRFLPELFESFWGKKVHVMIRFGMWQDILDLADARRPRPVQIHHLRDASGPRRRAGQSGPARGGRGGTGGRHRGARRLAGRLDGVQQHRRRRAGGRRGDDGRRDRVQGGPHRRGAGAFAAVGRDRRRAALR
jgi:tetratricopeptide (TPR) repeat protein